MHRGGQHRRGCRFRGVRLIAHTQVRENILGIGQHIHQVADRRALIAADVADPILKQCLGDRQNTLAGEGLALTEAEFPDFMCE